MLPTFTLLIVDDDVDDQEMLIEVATEINAGATCVTATNGYEALQLLAKEEISPDFIFLDLNMPRMGSKQCLEQLKKNPKTASIPVIIYTTSKLQQDKVEMQQLGAAHFITKPSRVAVLKEELEFVFLHDWTAAKQT